MSELADDRLREIEAWAELVSTFPPAEGHPPPKDYAESAAICTELLALRAAASTSTEGAGVKALEWRVPRQDSPRDPDAEDVVYCADGIGGLYSISRKQKVGPERLLWWAHDPFDWTGFDSIDAAKAAAQSDFERRILSCLNPPAPKVTTQERNA